MNNDKNMFELSDEQLDTVAGAGFGYKGYGVNIDLNINTPVNVAVAVPTLIAPTIGINVFSPGASVNGGNNGILAGIGQKA